MNVMTEIGRAADAIEMRVEWTPPVSRQAYFSVGLDTISGTVRIVGSGIWEAADAMRYFSDQRRVLDEARARFGPLKVFFDVREWIVEGPHSATQFQEVNRQLYRPEDRLVAVVASSLHKQYSRAALSVGNPEAFVSANAAETWLHAYTRR